LRCKREKTNYLENRCLAHGDKIPSTLVPCLNPTALTLTFQTPLTPPTPQPVLYYNDNINNFSFLIRNNSVSVFPSLQSHYHLRNTKKSCIHYANQFHKSKLTPARFTCHPQSQSWNLKFQDFRYWNRHSYAKEGL
jgi:hypothetical protein